MWRAQERRGGKELMSRCKYSKKTEGEKRRERKVNG